VHRGYVEPCDAGGVAELSKRRVSLGCVARGAQPGATRALPFGARLADDELAVSGEAVDPTTAHTRFPRDAEAIAETAAGYFAGTPYQWGGVTPWGADCSGLVQSVFTMHGVRMPRDAWQQAERGTDAGRELGALRAADLLFFSEREDQRVTHVGIALGGLRMVHLALGRGGYAIEKLDGSGDDYVRALLGRLVGARRVVP
jgi:cell wall-associated NlpC family hydrolase